MQFYCDLCSLQFEKHQCLCIEGFEYVQNKLMNHMDYGSKSHGHSEVICHILTIYCTISTFMDSERDVF